jgi:hypothetical protein
MRIDDDGTLLESDSHFIETVMKSKYHDSLESLNAPLRISVKELSWIWPTKSTSIRTKPFVPLSKAYRTFLCIAREKWTAQKVSIAPFVTKYDSICKHCILPGCTGWHTRRNKKHFVRKIVTNAIVVGMFGGFVDGNKLQHFDKPSITSITRGMFHTE